MNYALTTLFLQPVEQKKAGEIEWMCMNSRGFIHVFFASRQYDLDGIAETACRVCGAEAIPVDDKELFEGDWRQVFLESYNPQVRNQANDISEDFQLSYWQFMYILITDTIPHAIKYFWSCFFK